MREETMRGAMIASAILAAVLGGGACYPDAADWSGRTELMDASSAGYTTRVRIMLEQGADVDAQDACGLTSLMVASSAGHTEVVKLLLQYDANVLLETIHGDTALMHAVGSGNPDVVRLLLEYGAYTTVRESSRNKGVPYGETALEVAERMGHEEIAELLRQAEYYD